jgi:hypothetical protein
MPSGKIGYDAVDELFDITPNESGFLFDNNSYPIAKTIGAIGERYVAKRIRDFVDGKVSPE